jgi:exoribonuclease II
MAGITLAQAEDMLAEALTARSAIMTSQEYRVGDRSLKRALLSEVNQDIKDWNAEVKRLSRGGIRVTGVTPCG